MINSIHINNFQSHKNTKIDLHAGVNIIVGPSDQGKSSILRALNWVLFNKADDNEFRSHWGGDTVVSVIIDNHYRITRLKTASKNEYYMDWQNGPSPEDGQTDKFESFNRGVPEEIRSVINMDTINFQGQIDSSFLISETPGEVARQMNDIVDLGVIDKSLSNIESTYRSTRGDLDAKQNQIEELREGLKEYEHLDKFERMLSRLEKMQEHKEELEAENEIINEYCDKITSIRAKLESLPDVKAIENKLAVLMQLWSKIQRIEEKQTKLVQLGGSIRIAKEKIDQAQDTTQAKIKLDRLVKLHAKWTKLNDENLKLHQLIVGISIKEDVIKKQSIELVELERVFHDEMPDVCPLCGKEK